MPKWEQQNSVDITRNEMYLWESYGYSVGYLKESHTVSSLVFKGRVILCLLYHNDYGVDIVHWHFKLFTSKANL